jgi:DNA uptake protein ComE-like DNA-binding protein
MKVEKDNSKHYKVHIAYIDYNGRIIKPGVYNEKHIDTAEARHKSIITLEDINIEVKVTDIENAMAVQKFNMDMEYKELEFNPVITKNKLDKLDINIATEDEIAKIKYVGKTSARKVIIERDKTPFTSYVDLDQRSPLVSKKSWSDIAAIEFNYKPKVISLVEYI